jgi:2-(1,2-epoxy-1,2-dihydrophenyl)acetyl-CoA isomerase
MSYETILFDIDDNVATLTMNRPEALNAINLQLGEELMDAVTRCRADSNVRAVVVKGAGRAFCAGGDLKAFTSFLQGDPVVGFRTFMARLHAGIVEVRHMEKPVIAQVHGVAAGAGMSLALACDLTVAAESSQFVIAYSRVGLTPDGSSTYVIPRLVGPKKALEIFYTGDPIPAPEAQRLGLINRVIPDADLEKETRALARRLAQGPTLALGRAKELVYRSLGETLETQLEHERDFIALSAITEDFMEGIQAFIQKREPQFRGR